MEFLKDVWGGHDYIPAVWDQWVQDSRGKMFVVEADGVPVGMNRMRVVADGSAWLEGARVHPRYRSMGLGSMLGENSMRIAESLGISTFRLTSGSSNHAAHRQIARIRFKEIARFSVYEQARNVGRRGGETLLRDPAEALRMMKAQREYRLGRGVYWHGWAAAALYPRVVEKLVAESRVARLGDALAVVGRGGKGSGTRAEIGFLGGPPAEAAKLAASVLGRSGAEERIVFVPQRSPIIRELRKSGFRRRLSNILFERKAAKG
ncbi:MAG: GNAT family N-acetyltransferase [Nitrososphaerota archaeon]|nr:GNAT family N-acetyltransferase [Nitrososphaerota archaeon]